jgi:amidohydrolase
MADVPPGMGGEDMSYFINEASGAFYRLGARNEERGITYGHHHPRFDIDEDSLSTGVAMHVAVALRFLGE